MRRKFTILLSLSMLLILIACNRNPQMPDLFDGNELSVGSSCNVYESRNWHASLKKSTLTEGQYRLTITAEVDLPSPNYYIEWQMGITDRAIPPGQRIILFAKEQSDTTAIQVITPMKISFEKEVPFSAYRHISVYCGGEALTRLNDIKLVPQKDEVTVP